MKIRTIILSPLILAIAGCAAHESKPRTEKALEHIEQLDPNESSKETSSKLGAFGRYLARKDIGKNSNFEFSTIAEKYYEKSYGENEKYISLLISREYLEEVRKNNSINENKYLLFKRLLEEYEDKDLIVQEAFPSLNEIRNAIDEKKLFDVAYMSGVINENEYSWFNSEAWANRRVPLNQINQMLENIIQLNEGSDTSKDLISALIFSLDYNVANKIFEIYSKGLLDKEDTIKLLTQSNDFLKDTKYTYRGGMRAQFLLKYVYPKALEGAKVSDLITEHQFTDLKYKSETDTQDEKKSRTFSHLGAECSCLLHFSKLGFHWKKEYELGNKFTTAQLVFPYHEPFSDKHQIAFEAPKYNNQQHQQVLSER